VNALTKNGNGAEKPSSQSARNVAQRSRLRRNLLFAGVFALLAMIYVPTPARQYQSAHYRFIFDQHETGIAFFQLLVNVAFAALAGVLMAHAFRAIAKIPKRVIVIAGILAVVAGFALIVNYYRLKADSERQQGLYLHAAADYDRALFFGDLAGQCRREQAQIEQGQIEQAQRMERARLHTGVNAFDQFDPPVPPKTRPIPDWAKSASKKSDDTQEKK
jgi:hypothetical protein